MRRKWIVVFLVVFTFPLIMSSEIKSGVLKHQLKKMTVDDRTRAIAEIGNAGVQSKRYIPELFAMSAGEFPCFLENDLHLFGSDGDFIKTISQSCYEALLYIGEVGAPFYLNLIKKKRVALRVYALCLLLDMGYFDSHSLLSDLYPTLETGEQKLFLEWFRLKEMSLPEQTREYVESYLLDFSMNSFQLDVQNIFLLRRMTDAEAGDLLYFHTIISLNADYNWVKGNMKALNFHLKKIANGTDKEKEVSQRILWKKMEAKASFCLNDKVAIDEFISEIFQKNRGLFEEDGQSTFPTEKVLAFCRRAAYGSKEQLFRNRIRDHCQSSTLFREEVIYEAPFRIFIWKHLLGCTFVADESAEQLMNIGDPVLPFLEDRLNSENIADQILAVSALAKMSSTAAAEVKTAYYSNEKYLPDLRAYVIARNKVPLVMIPGFLEDLKKLLLSSHFPIERAAFLNMNYYESADFGPASKRLLGHPFSDIRYKADLLVQAQQTRERHIDLSVLKPTKWKSKKLPVNYFISGMEPEIYELQNIDSTILFDETIFNGFSSKIDKMNIPLWIQFLEGPGIDRKTLAIKQLSSIQDRNARSAIINMLDDPDYLVRLEVVKTLCEWNDTDLITQILSHLPNEKNLHVLSGIRKCLIACKDDKYDPVEDSKIKKLICDWQHSQIEVYRELAKCAMLHIDKNSALQMVKKDLSSSEKAVENPLNLFVLKFFDKSQLQEIRPEMYSLMKYYLFVLKNHGNILEQGDRTALCNLIQAVGKLQSKEGDNLICRFMEVLPEEHDILSEIAKLPSDYYDQLIEILGEPTDANYMVYFRIMGYFKPGKGKVELVKYLDYPTPIAIEAAKILAYLNGFKPYSDLALNLAVLESMQKRNEENKHAGTEYE